MPTFRVYIEMADNNKPRKYKGDIDAISMSNALQIASEWLELPSHDIVVEQVVAEPRNDERHFRKQK